MEANMLAFFLKRFVRNSGTVLLLGICNMQIEERRNSTQAPDMTWLALIKEKGMVKEEMDECF
jgi:hypothetical protein